MNRRLSKFITIFITLIVTLGLSTSISFGANNVTIKDYNKVPTLTVGQSYTIYGLIESKSKMNRVEVGVVSSKTNKWVTKYDKKIKSDYFSISKADPYVKFGKLGVGTYKYRIYAHSGKKVYTVLNQQFVVKAKPSKKKSVKEQQAFLNRVNVGTIQGKIAVDGRKGSQTTKAIKLFQQVEGLEVDGVWGAKTESASDKAISITGKRKAINWACSVANDNSFTYGVGSRAHRTGCYFCKTNTGNRMWKKERKGEPHKVSGHTYTKTYCCNPFITAAYAHGARDSVLYNRCYNGHSCHMTPATWKKSPYFKTVGKCKNVPFNKLQAGDVILSDKSGGGKYEHVYMYIGHNRYVEASGEGWSGDSISVKNNAKTNYNSNYAKYNGTYVMRYSK